MSGRAWRRRSHGQSDYDLVVTDERGGQLVAGFVSLQHGIERPTVLMDKIVALVAEHHGDVVDDPHTRGKVA